MTTEKLSRVEVQQLVSELAHLLGEKERGPIRQIKRVIKICGADFAREICKTTLEIEANGGMLLANKSRRRTPGGVFFHLVRSKVNETQRQLIFPGFINARVASQPVPLGVLLLTWTDRIDLTQSLQTEAGTVESMKVTLRGRPEQVEKQTEVVVATLSNVASAPNLPRSIPRPPEVPTLYTVYIAPEHWEKIEAGMATPDNVLVVEGMCAIPTRNMITVFANYARCEDKTGKTVAAPTKPTTVKEPANVAPEPAKKSRIAGIQPEPVVRVQLNPNLPPDVARKLSELQSSAGVFRQKVATILSKPVGQQFGLEMTQKLLKNVEAEIAALEQKYAE